MNVPARPNTIHELFDHIIRKVPAYRVTGCLGPRNLLQRRATDLESLDYGENTDLVEWAQEHQGEFDLTG
jgi:hypothetical protein